MTVLEPPDDPELVAAIERYRPAILRYFRRKVRRAEIAEELTQDTLARATASWPTYDPSLSKPNTWLFKIAWRVLSDHYEWDAKVRVAEAAWAATEPREARELEARLPGKYAAAFRRLPEADQQVLWLVVVRDMSPEVVGRMLGISRAGASTRAMRALERLHKKMKEI